MIVCPALYRVPSAGWVIVATGGAFPVTVSVAGLLVALPALFETTQRNWAPVSDALTEAIV